MGRNFIVQFNLDIGKMLGLASVDVYDDRDDDPIPRTDIMYSIELDQMEPTTFILREKRGDMIARWSLQEMPACCGIAILSEFYVNPRYRKKGVAARTNAFIKHLVKRMNYKVLLATDLANNNHHQKVLRKGKWKSLVKFRNKNTGNKINISAAVL